MRNIPGDQRCDRTASRGGNGGSRAAGDPENIVRRDSGVWDDDRDELGASTVSGLRAS